MLDLLNIHQQLHTPNQKVVVINNKKFPILKGPKTQLRYVEIENIKFIEQNPDKTTWHSKQAKKGTNITWGIRSEKDWICIYDDKILVGE